MKPGVLWLALSLLACACRASPPSPLLETPTSPEILNIGLASSAAGVAELVGKAYASVNERVILQFVTANTDTLYADLELGRFDAILVHVVPAGADVWFNPVAMDGLALVVHRDNPVADVSRREAQGILSGRLAEWQSLAPAGAGLDGIKVISRESGAGTRRIVTQRLMDGLPIAIEAVVVAGNQALLQAVAADPAAIGYTMMGSAGGATLLAIDGVQPTPVTTAAQLYPLAAPLYFVIGNRETGAAEPAGELRAFLAWLQSVEGQTVMGERYGRIR